MSGTKMTVGSRAQVWHGTAKHTSGGLTKTQLMMNKSGRIVSRKKHASAKKDNRLVKAGYKTKKGHFGFVKVGSRKRGHKGRKGHRGGSGGNRALSPLELGDGIDGQGITDYGLGANNVQMAASMSGGAIYGSDSIGANLSDAFGSSDMKNGPSGDGISGAGITNFGSGSIGVQMRAGMSAGGKRRKSRRMMGGDGSSGTSEDYVTSEVLTHGGRRHRKSRGMMGGTGDTVEDPTLSAALQAGGRRRKGKRSMSMYGGTGTRGPIMDSALLRSLN
jgi:hypothetical protein